MVAKGACNCGSITITLPSLPSRSILCYCFNCRRAGGPCSVNYVIELSEIEIEDAQNTLKSYQDSNTKSGNTITRRFCGNCGSPVMSLVPGMTKVFVKGSLFDSMSEPNSEFFLERKPDWMEGVKIKETGA
ncbi:uncharacterized protein BDR25DRAFT_289884 [Lindgomyces ingoldianus]|uniref:Uncharacterized protein n=1 Tax=Lindgomyces ingoldianus TaxID=673940 RepID=A0ACB6QS26_9PLEO|nr:uncharacterized protein BDR25DRAFT_289884 [Lindgomyces ingoldianus]KAF2468905.1 hypothetical protein BDR25DRAFT_289884 [Lindgomyces ingoldianus]